MMNHHRHSPAEEAGLAGLATYLQQMREEERGELARELHDELGALLTCAKLDVAGLKSRVGGASTEIDQRLAHLGEMINNGIAFSRRVVEGLHPSSLANLGLKASLEILTHEFALSSGMAMTTQIDEVDIDAETQLTVYRVVQESLNNANKYAAAAQGRVVLLNCDDDVVLAVSDDGKGFDTAAMGTSSHGLAGMRHRVEARGGQLTVSSVKGSGTLVVAVLPALAGSGTYPSH